MSATKPFYEKEIRGINLKLVYGFFGIVFSILVSTIVITNKVTGYVVRVDNGIKEATVKAEAADNKAQHALKLIASKVDTTKLVATPAFIQTLNTQR